MDWYISGQVICSEEAQHSSSANMPLTFVTRSRPISTDVDNFASTSAPPSLCPYRALSTIFDTRVITPVHHGNHLFLHSHLELVAVLRPIIRAYIKKSVSVARTPMILTTKLSLLL